MDKKQLKEGRGILKVRLNGKEYSHQEIIESYELKEKLVNENPKLAEKLYYIWRETGEEDLGKIFAKKYNGDKEYGMIAFHIGNELGISGMMRQSNSVLDQIEKIEGSFSPKYNIKK